MAMSNNLLPLAGRAAILTKQHSPLVVDSVGLPQTLAPGQVMVQVHYSGICGSQLGEIDGVKGPDAYLPHLLGHEGSATVLAIGPGVVHVAVGDLVVLHWRKGAGIEAAPASYNWAGATVNAGWVTTFNEFAVVSENRCTAIPVDSDRRLAALFGCAVTTGFGVVENNAQVRAGESVVVYGSGGVGLSIVQAAALHGAYPIIGVDLHENRLALALDMGATHVINGRDDGVENSIIDLVGRTGADLFVDNTGVPAVMELGYRVTSSAGRVVLVGVPKSDEQMSFRPLALYFGKDLTGSHGGESVPERDIPRLMRMFQAGRLRLDEMVTTCVSLDEVNEAIGLMRSGETAGRCLLSVDGS